MKSLNILIALLVATTGTAYAQAPATDHGADKIGGASTATASPGEMTDGEVRKVDKEAGKVTLRHGPLKNLDMPAMTMVFRVADPKMLDTLKQGDKVKFVADKVNGAFTVTAIEPAE
jgi:Cu/Ag efflux protein CusF